MASDNGKDGKWVGTDWGTDWRKRPHPQAGPYIDGRIAHPLEDCPCPKCKTIRREEKKFSIKLGVLIVLGAAAAGWYVAPIIWGMFFEAK